VDVTIQDIGSIGELVGALATVATLAYLAVQIRANTRMMRLQSRHAGRALSSQNSMGLAQDHQLAGVFRRGLVSFESLEPDEQIQFTFLLAQYILNLEHHFDDFKSGLTDGAPFERAWTGVEHILKSPGGRAFWKNQGRRSYPPDFAEFIESHLHDREDPEPATPGTATQPGAAADSA
jgi:hypothetical protein